MRTLVRVTLVAAAGTLAGGCAIPERDNPLDPAKLEPPAITLLRMQAFNCRQWVYPHVEGYTALHESPFITTAEAEDVDEFCEAICPSVDPSGPEDDVYVPNPCQESHVLAGARLGDRDDAVSCEGTRSLLFSEIAPSSVPPPTLDVIAFASSGPIGAALTAETVAEEADGIRAVTIEPGMNTGYAVSFITPDLAASFPIEEENPGVTAGILLTRDLRDSDRLQIDSALKSSNRRGDSTCTVRVNIEQRMEVFQHPLGLAGGYGATVAAGNLSMDDGRFEGRAMEFATSYRIGSACFMDLLYRDPTSRYQHWGFEGNDPFRTACRENGDPPPALLVPLSVDTGGGAVADTLAVMAEDERRLHFFEGDGGFGLSLAAELAWTDASDAAPARLAYVGEQLGQDGRGEIALVTAAEDRLLVCTPGAPATDGTCVEPVLPDCGGFPVDRIAAVAPWVDGFPPLPVLAALQADENTCLVQLVANTAGSLSGTVLSEYPTRPETVAVHWDQSGGAELPIIVGYLDPGNAFSAAFEVQSVGVEREFRVMDTDTCAAGSFLGPGDGIGAAAAVVPRLACGSAGCLLESDRLIGLPRLDALAPVAGEPSLLADAGGVAWLRPECAEGRYGLRELETPGVLPASLGASFAARVDPTRGRRRDASPTSDCILPSTIAVGAPAGGASDGAGHVIVVYDRAGSSFESCTPP